ncbi:MAG: hypothetical protein ABI852_14520 [Gemmatimonadaceae bacterium]
MADVGEPSVGFESAYAARRRLAMVAITNEHVHEVLAPAGFSGLTLERNTDGPNASDHSRSTVESHKNEQLSASTLPERAESERGVAAHLDQLAQEIVSTPGAGGALLVAFAAQARALSLVVEAARRTHGAAGLPAEVMAAVQNALRVPMPMGLELA